MYGATSRYNGFMYIVFVDVASEKRTVNFIKIADFVASRTFSGTYSDDTSTLTINASETIWGGIKKNSKASRFDGNIKKVGFRSGQRALNNIYLDFYDSNNSRTSLAFTTDGENAIKFLVNDEEKWKVVVK